jgi:hypothetical protein
MKKVKAIILFIGITTVCFGQLSDDFSDGDFSGNPVWSGTTAQFIVNASKQLQLNDNVSRYSFLSTPFTTSTLDDYEWRVYVKLSFIPSGNNYGRVYLASDQSDLSQPLNGYYLQFGEALNNDAVELFFQRGATSTSVCRGKAAGVAAAFAIRVKVNRDHSGLWQLYVDYAGGTDFVLDASGTETSITSSSFFGVRCNYTMSNAAKFFFDDILIVAPATTPPSPPSPPPPPPPPSDTSAPTVVSVQIASSNSLSIAFSESIGASASQLANYSVNNSFGNPQSAALQEDGRTVLLTFSTSFPNGVENQISISNVKDLAGNTIIEVISPFMFFEAVPPSRKDIIFTEIFPDPSPQVSLPVQEFVEVYNRSSNPFDLAGWKLSDGTSTATLPSKIILPNQYWIICSSANASLFSS